MTTLLYDGSFRGFLTCLARLLTADNTLPPTPPLFLPEPSLIPAEHVPTDNTQARAVQRLLTERASRRCLRTAELAFCSEEPGRETVLYGYLRLALLHGPDVDRLLLEPAVQRARNLALAVGRETHRYLGITRFEETPSGWLVAFIEPQHFILPFLGDHFRRRFTAHPWAIIDPSRSKVLLCHNGHLRLETRPAPPSPAPKDRTIHLWKTYLEAVTIPERLNPRLQQSHLPLRHRKHLPEF